MDITELVALAGLAKQIYEGIRDAVLKAGSMTPEEFEAAAQAEADRLRKLGKAIDDDCDKKFPSEK